MNRTEFQDLIDQERFMPFETSANGLNDHRAGQSQDSLTSIKSPYKAF
jgi:hypothetical protein